YSIGTCKSIAHACIRSAVESEFCRISPTLRQHWNSNCALRAVICYSEIVYALCQWRARAAEFNCNESCIGEVSACAEANSIYKVSGDSIASFSGHINLNLDIIICANQCGAHFVDADHILGQAFTNAILLQGTR